MTGEQTEVGRITPAEHSRFSVPPITVWSLVGIAVVGSQTWILARWVGYNHFHVVFSGGDQMSVARRTVSWIVQVSVLVTAVGVITYVARRSLRRRQILVDAALCLGLFTIIWQAPIIYYGSTTIAYNRYYLSVPTWGPYVPGWTTDRPSAYLEPLLTSCLGYITVLPMVWLLVVVVREILRVRPHWVGARLAAICFLAAMVLDVAVELLWIRVGGYAYVRAYPPLTLFAGHWYQFPLAITIPTAGMLTALTLTVHHMNLGPDTLIFSGSAQLPPPLRLWARLLAGAGFANVVFLVFTIGINVALRLGQPISYLPRYFAPQ